MKTIFILIMMALPVQAVESVDNGLTAKKGKTLTFKENLRLSPDSGEDYHIWSGNVSVEVNHQGHLFVVDPGAPMLVRTSKESCIR